MEGVHALARTVRRLTGPSPSKLVGMALAIALFGITLACARGGSTVPFDTAYRLGQNTSETAFEAYEADRAIREKLTFEPFTFQRATGLDTVPMVTRTCGVKYTVSPERWGIVPNLTYACDDGQARQKALDDARSRLRSGSGITAGEYEARLAVLRGPVEIMKEEGPTLVYAQALGVDFDLGACVDSLSGRMESSAAQIAALQCETFLKPGAAPAELRKKLSEAADRALGMTEVASAQPAIAILPDTASRCQADPGGSGLPVPGSVSGVLGSGRDMAYAIRLNAGQSVDIGLSSSVFDSILRLYDASCNRVLASDDDGGDGRNARLRWTSPAGGDYVVVASSYQRSGRGPFELRVSTDSTVRLLSEDEKQAVRAFAQWVKGASEEDVVAAWRATASSDLQLGCLSQVRLESETIRRVSSVEDAFSSCTAGLKRATDARKEVIAAAKK